MKGWSIIGLLFAAAVIATIPVSPQVTPRGVELGVDQAQAQTYGRSRRLARRSNRYARRADRQAGYAALGYGSGYVGGDGYGRRVWVGPNRWCMIYPSGFRWCWTGII